MQSLTVYIQNPDLLDALATDELRMIVDRYPVFQAARLLYLRGLYLHQDEHFGAELRKAALYVPDRRQLFELIEGEKFRITSMGVSSASTETQEDSSDRTQALISSFLSARPDASSRQTRRSKAVDAGVDYMAYLMQQEEDEMGVLPSVHPPVLSTESSEHTSPTSAADSVADSPSDVTLADESEERLADEDAHLDNELSDVLFTETLARIYIKQGKYSKAIEIIRRLSLNFPKKNRYFADQIRFLEKILINERNQNSE